jgi:putative ABC transport system ATP-binding protein
MSLHADKNPLIRLAGVSKTYGHDGVPVAALRNVDLAVSVGEFTAVMGPSGSGKSTLLHILGLLDADYAGTYDLGGERVSGRAQDELSRLRNREIGFVFQQFHLSPQECRQRARARLAQVGLGNRLDHRPNEVSAGQRQRTAIARALVNEPRLILADEPTGALDSKSTQELMDLFSELHEAGSTILLITHDREVASVAERIIHVRDGQTIDGLV